MDWSPITKISLFSLKARGVCIAAPNLKNIPEIYRIWMSIPEMIY
jgi:hypothetical protein